MPNQRTSRPRRAIRPLTRSVLQATEKYEHIIQERQYSTEPMASLASRRQRAGRLLDLGVLVIRQCQRGVCYGRCRGLADNGPSRAGGVVDCSNCRKMSGGETVVGLSHRVVTRYLRRRHDNSESCRGTRLGA